MHNGEAPFHHCVSQQLPAIVSNCRRGLILSEHGADPTHGRTHRAVSRACVIFELTPFENSLGELALVFRYPQELGFWIDTALGYLAFNSWPIVFRFRASPTSRRRGVHL